VSSFSCPECRKCGCTCGVLPLTAQLTLSGIPLTLRAEVSPIGFISCVGSGAMAAVDSPGGCPANDVALCVRPDGSHVDDSGPLESVSLIDGGSCYAIVARSEPDISLSATPTGEAVDGSGESVPSEEAKFTAKLEQKYTELCKHTTGPLAGVSFKVPYWAISAIEVQGGKGYKGGEQIKVVKAKPNIPAGNGDIVLLDAAAVVKIKANNSLGVPDGISLGDGSLTDGGAYYKERTDLPGLASPVVGVMGYKVQQVQGEPRLVAGDPGVLIRGTVDTTATSDTFGQVVSLAIEKAGDNVLGWTHADNSCLLMLNEAPLPLLATQTRRLVSFEAEACFGGGVCVVVEEVKKRSEPALNVCVSDICTMPIEGSDPLMYENVGCGVKIDYGTASKLINDDPLQRVWYLSSVSASGGGKFIPGTIETGVIVTPADPISRVNKNYPSTGFCRVSGSLPSIVVHIDPETRKVTGATLVSPGAYYLERDYLGQPSAIERISLAATGSGYAKLGRVAPTLTLETDKSMGGGGVTLTPTLGTDKDDCGIDYWFIESVKVSGGTKYASGGNVTVKAAVGDTVAEAARVSLAINDAGVPTVATVQEPGKYWRESKNAPPYVATLTSKCLQLPPSNGSGAEITFTVNSDPNSGGFGRVSKAKIANGGSGYTILGQAGCTYGSNCGTVGVTIGRDEVSVELSRYYEDIRLRGDGVSADCSSGSVSLNAVKGGPGINGVLSWPYGGDACGPSGRDCGPACPLIEHLCIGVTWQSPVGTRHTKTTKRAQVVPDSTSVFGGSQGFFFEELYPDPVFPYLFAELFVYCYVPGTIVINGGWNGPIDHLGCHNQGSAYGSMSVRCKPGRWWEGTYRLVLEYPDIGIPNDEGCPDPGFFEVTISTPASVDDKC